MKIHFLAVGHDDIVVSSPTASDCRIANNLKLQ